MPAYPLLLTSDGLPQVALARLGGKRALLGSFADWLGLFFASNLHWRRQLFSVDDSWGLDSLSLLVFDPPGWGSAAIFRSMLPKHPRELPFGQRCPVVSHKFRRLFAMVSDETCDQRNYLPSNSQSFCVRHQARMGTAPFPFWTCRSGDP
jgi:hypothetical protein